jgi:hypothetical protein
MKIEIFLASVALVAVAHAGDVSEVASTRSVDTFPAFSSAGLVNLVAAHSMLSVHLPDGTPRQDELLVLFDPASGKYLWEHDIVLREDEGHATYFRARLSTFNSALYADKDGIAWFFFASMNLTVGRSSGEARNLDAAYDQALHELQAHWLDHIERKGEFRKTSEVWKLVPQDFFFGPADVRPIPAPAVEDVKRSDTGWVLTIRGRWRAKLILDQGFEAKSVERISDQAGAARPK